MRAYFFTAVARIVALAVGVAVVSPTMVAAQVSVSPSSVNVNAQGVTTAILTFSGVGGYTMAEALWCGELVSATPAGGFRCAPGSVFGQVPSRYDRTSGSTFDALSDVMTIPASVARRAYQDAAAGSNSAFYYVRRFRSDAGIDQYAAVTLRLTGGGARTPLSITDVQLSFDPDVPVLYVANGDVPTPLEAILRYTGSGRLTGRWEIVYPGEQVPSAADLLTEGTAPADQRRTQRRYTQLSRFNVFLPPTGRMVLPGPDPARLPTATDGIYYLLLRLESAFDAESQTETTGSIDGEFVIRTGGLSGGAAGFSLPMLRYVVGSGSARAAAPRSVGSVRLRSPAAGATVNPSTLVFVWDALARAEQYRVEVGAPDGTRVMAAIVPRTTRRYEAPPWLATSAPQPRLRWRVIALDARGREIGRSNWSALVMRRGSNE